MTRQHYRLLIPLVTLACMFLLAAPPGWTGTWQDDFSDGNLGGWNKSDNAQWEVVDGKCHVSFAGGVNLTILLVVGEPDWTDYSVKLEFETHQASTWIGMSLRVQDAQNSHSWAVDCTDNTVHWITTVNNQPNIVTSNPVVGNLVGESHHLQTIVQGNEFQGYFDGKLIRTTQLAGFGTGKVALLLRPWGFPASATFDNVTIIGDGIADIGPSGWSIGRGTQLATTWSALRQKR